MKQNLNRTTPTALVLSAIVACPSALHPFPAGASPAPLLNDPVDVSADFQNVANTLFLADKLVWFAAHRQIADQLDWSKLELVSFADQASGAKGFVCLPSDNKLIEVALNKSGNALKLASDPLAGKVTWKLRAHAEPAK